MTERFIDGGVDPSAIERGSPGEASAPDPDDAAIWTAALSKTYRKGARRAVVRALERLTLSVAPGQIFGFLGHNGAGKSTTIKLLTGMIRPSGGSARVAGARAGSVRARSRAGYLPENPSLGDGWTGRELLAMSAALAGMRGADAAREVSRLVERLELGLFADRRLGKMSKGQTQLVGLAHALLGSPSVLILDEPMSGLDPMARKAVRDILLELRASGRTIFFSSHILADVELICDRVALVTRGRLAGIYSLDQIRAAGERSLEVVARGIDVATVAARGAPIADVRRAGDSVVFRVTDPARSNDVLGFLLGRGATIASVTSRGATLEEFVLARIGGDGADRAPEHEPESGPSLERPELRAGGRS